MKLSATGETGIKQMSLDTDTLDMEPDRRTCAPGCSPFSWRRKSRKKSRAPATSEKGLSPRFSGAEPMLSLHSSSGSSLNGSVTSPSPAERKSPASAASPKTLSATETNGLTSPAASTTLIHPVQPLVGSGPAEEKAIEVQDSTMPASGKEAAQQGMRLSEGDTFLDALAEHAESGEAEYEIDRSKSAGAVVSPAAEMEYEKRPIRTPSAPSPEMRRTPSGNYRSVRAASDIERPRGPSLDKKPSFSDRVSQFFSRKSAMFNNSDSPADTASTAPQGSSESSHLRRTNTTLEHPTGIVDPIERPAGTVVERHDIPYEAQSTPVPHSWSTKVPGKSFQVRGRSYLADKKKVASEECLYYSYSVEAYRTEEKTFDIAGRLKIQADTVAGLPTLLVLNMMVPDYAPSFGFKAKAQDGPGISIIVYAAMTDQTRAALEALQRGEEVAPVYKLLRNFLKGDGPGTDSPNLETPAHKNEYRTRVKVMAKVAAGQDSLPWAVKMALNQGNGKPFIVSKCGTFIDHERGVFEIDSDVHNFIPMALKGLNNCKTYFTQLIMDIGLVIEARNSHELPEQMLLTYRFCNPDLKQVVQNIKSLNMK